LGWGILFGVIVEINGVEYNAVVAKHRTIPRLHLFSAASAEVYFGHNRLLPQFELNFIHVIHRVSLNQKCLQTPGFNHTLYGIGDDCGVVELAALVSRDHEAESGLRRRDLPLGFQQNPFGRPLYEERELIEVVYMPSFGVVGKAKVYTIAVLSLCHDRNFVSACVHCYRWILLHVSMQVDLYFSSCVSEAFTRGLEKNGRRISALLQPHVVVKTLLSNLLKLKCDHAPYGHYPLKVKGLQSITRAIAIVDCRC